MVFADGGLSTIILLAVLPLANGRRLPRQLPPYTVEPKVWRMSLRLQSQL
jgi:hypothetical protein